MVRATPVLFACASIALLFALAAVPTAQSIAKASIQNCTHDEHDTENPVTHAHDYGYKTHCLVRSDGIDCTEEASGHYNDPNGSYSTYSNGCLVSFPTNVPIDLAV